MAILEEISTLMQQGRAPKVKELVTQALEEGIGPKEILEEGREDSLVVPHGKSSLSVQKEDIVYIERINRKTIIHTQNDEVESAIRLDELEKQLDSRFIRCHKSFIVNFKYCVKLKASEMLLKNGVSVSISRPNAQKTKAAFFAYHKKSIVH